MQTSISLPKLFWTGLDTSPIGQKYNVLISSCYRFRFDARENCLAVMSEKMGLFRLTLVCFYWYIKFPIPIFTRYLKKYSTRMTGNDIKAIAQAQKNVRDADNVHRGRVISRFPALAGSYVRLK